MSRYFCCDEKRRNAVAAHATLNGIDYLEVLDKDAPAGSPRQRTLMVRFLKAAPSFGLDNLLLSGGERIRNIELEWAVVASAVTSSTPPELTPAEVTFFPALPDADRVLLIRTRSNGDFSRYELRLRENKDSLLPPAGIDPRMAAVSFSFKVECESDFDCKPSNECVEAVSPPPEINYLAKDYATFRRLLLDRLSQVSPSWSARTPADLGVTLVELLAYAGDQLSYWQDSVATEAYLETARRRISLRRHALLVDYAIHEGSNARTWVQLQLSADAPTEHTVSLLGLRFFTRIPGSPSRIPSDVLSKEYREAVAAKPLVFEPVDPAGRLELELEPPATITLFKAHHEINFYTWGDERCCLPKGATSATLAGAFAALQVGQVLIFEEVLNPSTGEPQDVDRERRHAVRLTEVTISVDPLPASQPAITEIKWAPADALLFPLCISARTAAAPDAPEGKFIEGISVARGNIVLADHGESIRGEALVSVPNETMRIPSHAPGASCDRAEPKLIPVRYRPVLARRPLTHAGTILKREVHGSKTTLERLAFDPTAPASDAFRWMREDILPVIDLTADDGSGSSIEYECRRDLLNSEARHSHFVVEMEHDGSAHLRFGDDRHARRPESGTQFSARYRIGQGLGGNIGADALAHVVSDDPHLGAVRNPLPARGGTEPETADQIRRRAPQAFRTQKRAVTPEDYAAVTGKFEEVQRAAATQRWTGSWHTMFVTVDRQGGAEMDDRARGRLKSFVEPYRMAGHDLVFDDPIHVSLEIEMLVCVERGYFSADVERELLRVLGRDVLPNGRRGYFHPDAFTFGQAVYLSPIYAAARAVAGVETVEITCFRRLGDTGDTLSLQGEVMHLGRLEIARLDNDKNFPERGVLRLNLHGGQ